MTLPRLFTPWMSGFPLALLAALLADPAAAADQAKVANTPVQDKSQYNLFNPTPTDAMRDMTPDRPDTTESPFTVDAGHFQVEMSLLDYQRDFDRGNRQEDWSYGQMNVRAGITDDMDMHLIFNSYTTERTSAQGVTNSVSGFSDVTFRIKKNLWGNDGGTTALALLPFVTIPTRANLGSNRWAGGFILPFSIQFSDKISLSTMVEMDLVPDATTSGYDLQWVQSASLGIELTKRVGIYLELAGVAGGSGFDYQANFNTGLAYNVTDNLVLDAGIRLGLNRAAPEFGTFTGVSIRF